MRILRMVQFDEDDEPDIRRIEEWANEAMSFFTDRKVEVGEEGDGLKTIRRLSSGHSFPVEHLTEVLKEIVKAQERIREQMSDQSFPTELKERYFDNLLVAEATVQSWIDKAISNSQIVSPSLPS